MTLGSHSFYEGCSLSHDLSVCVFHTRAGKSWSVSRPVLFPSISWISFQICGSLWLKYLMRVVVWWNSEKNDSQQSLENSLIILVDCLVHILVLSIKIWKGIFCHLCSSTSEISCQLSYKISRKHNTITQQRCCWSWWPYTCIHQRCIGHWMVHLCCCHIQLGVQPKCVSSY